MSAGIDYGMGTANVDKANGIRYGVISQNSVAQALSDSDLEYDYGDPTCPKCGNVATDSAELPEESEEWEIADHACSDYGCKECKYIFDSSEAFGDEPNGWSYSADGYELTDCLDNDVFVLKSPFYTFAPFCSPCVPGAGNLDSAETAFRRQKENHIDSPELAGVKTYCLGHDWFEEREAPYPVFSVETGAEVHPEMVS